jgi:hypothetical protein
LTCHLTQKLRIESVKASRLAARGESDGLRENGGELRKEQRSEAETRRISPFLPSESRVLRELAGRADFHHGLLGTEVRDFGEAPSHRMCKSRPEACRSKQA